MTTLNYCLSTLCKSYSKIREMKVCVCVIQPFTAEEHCEEHTPGSEGQRCRCLQRELPHIDAQTAGLHLRNRRGEGAFQTPQHVAQNVPGTHTHTRTHHITSEELHQTHSRHSSDSCKDQQQQDRFIHRLRSSPHWTRLRSALN